MTVISIQRLHGKAERDNDDLVMKNQTSETKNKTMKIVVIGGTGLIGTKLVNNSVNKVTKSWPRPLRKATIRSRGRDWRRRWLGHKESLVSRTLLRVTT